MGKIKHSDFIRQISKRTGYSQVDIKCVNEAALEILKENMKNGNATAVFKGITIETRNVPETTKHIPNGNVIVVPAHETPRARFTPTFKEEFK